MEGNPWCGRLDGRSTQALRLGRVSIDFGCGGEQRNHAPSDPQHALFGPAHVTQRDIPGGQHQPPRVRQPGDDDGKTLQREAIDSARAAGFAVLTATVMLVGILSGIGVVLIG